MKRKRKPQPRPPVRKPAKVQVPAVLAPDVLALFAGSVEPAVHDCLTEQQRLFVAAYLGPACGNAAAAARLAGYKGGRSGQRVAGCRALAHPDVQQALAHARARKLGSPAWVRNSLVDLAGGTLENFVDADGLVDIDKARSAGAMGQLREVTTDVLQASGKSKVVRVRVKLHDRRAALETLAKLDGKINDGTQMTFGPNAQVHVHAGMEALRANPDAYAQAVQLAARLQVPAATGAAPPPSANGNGHSTHGHNGNGGG